MILPPLVRVRGKDAVVKPRTVTVLRVEVVVGLVLDGAPPAELFGEDFSWISELRHLDNRTRIRGTVVVHYVLFM